jgi:hypothetical protein
VPARALEAVYPRLPDFRRLVQRFDGGGKFRNDFIARHVDGETSVTGAGGP